MKKTASTKRIGEIGAVVAEVPALPGCFTQAETLDELVVHLDEAIQGWLESQSLDELRALNVPFTVVLGEDVGASAHYPLIRNLQLAA